MQNIWYLINFLWRKKVKWQLVDKIGDLFVKTELVRMKIERLLMDTDSNLLGVWMYLDVNLLNY